MPKVFRNARIRTGNGQDVSIHKGRRGLHPGTGSLQ